MTTRIGSKIRKSKSKLTKSYRTKGKISLNRYFQSLKKGEIVVLKAEPSVQTGMHPLRFQGKPATIQGMKGKCYEVTIKDGSKQKSLIVHPVHMIKVSK